MEGDTREHSASDAYFAFLSTPSGWRATASSRAPCCDHAISIHALRVEGDSLPPPLGRPLPVFLSTPSGWRATQLKKNLHYRQNISIHALRVEGDKACSCIPGITAADFYPRPPGDTKLSQIHRTSVVFLSTPSGWRATAKTDKVFVCFCAKGRRICLFKTRKEKICRWRFKKDKFWALIWCEGSGKSVCASASHCG